MNAAVSLAPSTVQAAPDSSTASPDLADVDRFQTALRGVPGDMPGSGTTPLRTMFSDAARNMEHDWKSSLNFAANMGRNGGPMQLRDLLSLQIRMGRLTVNTLAFNKVASAVPQAANELTRMH
ncbi:MAG: hypothetical protein ACRYG5_15825 [Janthinobacterium lividum]